MTRFEDGEILTVGLVWKLRPTRVEVVNPVSPPLRWTLEPEEPFEPEAVNPVSPEEDIQDAQDASAESAEEAAEEEAPLTPGQIQDAAEAFNAFDWLTRVGFFLLAGLVLWIYRDRLGRLIPGGNGGSKKKD